MAIFSNLINLNTQDQKFATQYAMLNKNSKSRELKFLEVNRIFFLSIISIVENVTLLIYIFVWGFFLIRFLVLTLQQ